MQVCTESAHVDSEKSLTLMCPLVFDITAYSAPLVKVVNEFRLVQHPLSGTLQGPQDVHPS